MFHSILELYSGIGGMHCAWNESGIPGHIAAAVDINTVANEVYQHNFQDTNLLNKNIQSLTVAEINKMCVDTILMSPPCQPFTRNGKYLDNNDPRTDSFLYLLNILRSLENIKYILMENVKGFETSIVRNLFIDKLKECNFDFQEFLICPSSVGVPNSRLRYYCIAHKNNSIWHFKRKDEFVRRLPRDYGTPYTLESIIQEEVPDKFLVTDKNLKRANIFDICHRESSRSCCFTKAYSHYIEGTGSVYTDASPEKVKECFLIANTFDVGSEAFIEAIKQLKIRFFTPQEVLSLMEFPKMYSFPSTVTTKQCYRLLGNSVNVKVISELLKILFNK